METELVRWEFLRDQNPEKRTEKVSLCLFKVYGQGPNLPLGGCFGEIQ